MRDGVLVESTEDLYSAIEQRRKFQKKQKWPEIECNFSGYVFFPNPHQEIQNLNVKNWKC